MIKHIPVSGLVPGATYEITIRGKRVDGSYTEWYKTTDKWGNNNSEITHQITIDSNIPTGGSVMVIGNDGTISNDNKYYSVPNAIGVPVKLISTNNTLPVSPISLLGNKRTLEAQFSIFSDASYGTTTRPINGLAFASNEIQSFYIDNSVESSGNFTTSSSSLYVNRQGGNIEFGSSQVSPSGTSDHIYFYTLDGSFTTRLRVATSANTVDPGSATGYTFMVGTAGGAALRFDSNEIQATNSTNTSTLFLNSRGGVVSIGGQIQSTYSAGAPFTVASTTKVANLNADFLDGLDQGSFLRSNATDTASGDLTFTGSILINQSIAGTSWQIYQPGTSSSAAYLATDIVSAGLYTIKRNASSSMRYKNSITDIENIENLNVDKLLELKVRAFKWNNDYLSETDSRYDTLVPGFIAEEVYSVYPLAAELSIDSNGNPIPESWNVNMIIPGMLRLIQKQHLRIENLETRLAALENK